MQTLAGDLRHALRGLRRQPGFTGSVVATLALGIGANVAIFSLVRAVLLKPLPYHDPERIVVLWERSKQHRAEPALVAPPNYADWVDQNRVFESLAFVPAYGTARQFNLQRQDGNEKINGAAVSSGLFPLLGVKPALGRWFRAEEDAIGSPNSAILSHSLWMRTYAGDRGVIGRTLTLDSYNLVKFEIVGVMPPGFSFPDDSELWVSFGVTKLLVPPPGSSQRCCRLFQVFGRLKDGVTIGQARAQMSAIQGRLAAQYPAADVSPDVSVVGLHDQVAGNVRLALYTLMGAVGAVLLIACANIASLMMARATARQRDYVVRVSMGATGWRMARLALTESLALALAGGLIGLLLAAAATQAMVSALPGLVPRASEIGVDWAVVAFALLLSTAAGVGFGLLPALQAARVNLGEALREAGRSGAGGVARQRLRQALVVVEIGVTVVLVICAGLLIESLYRLQRVDVGFPTERLLTANIDISSASYRRNPNRRPQAFFDSLTGRIAALPGVVAAGGVSQLPLTGAASRAQGFMIRGRVPASDADLPTAGVGGITPGGIEALGLRLLAGRAPSAADGPDTPPVVAINETMARRYWPGYPKASPIGERIVIGSGERMDRDRATGEPRWREIVGVVSDVRGLGLDRDPRPEIYAPHWQWGWHTADLAVRTRGDPRTLTSSIRSVARELDRNVVVTAVRTMDEVVAGATAEPRFRSFLLGAFSLAGVLLAAVGVFGVMSYAVAQRTHEIGVRMALGALPGAVRRMVLKQALGLAMVGAALGAGGAWGVTRLLEKLLFGVRTDQWSTFAGAALLLEVVAFVAAWLPARRATRINPIEALRWE